ncbi:protein lifeguard 3 isoform X1 [Lingula anatina]|uniref:Protein lifeguard 3 isoform X1 n=1 Tax=Lingula anatina TaxID=7574 RepID=A0A1S3H1N7_LINAN|nr:protein lifeguard 3 isoform X1 [Lingula anatina]|eukprot:XP_013379933.1 protein lifeguard 3 isoform X1 [Lingula anatina]
MATAPPPPSYNDATNPGYGYSDPNAPNAGYAPVPLKEMDNAGQPPPPQPAGYGYGTGYAAPPPGGYSQPQPTGYAAPKPEDTSYTVEEEWAGQSFSDKAVRRNFIKKVYLILAAQLAVTFGIVCIFSLVEPVGLFVRQNIWLYWISYALFIILYIVLVCVREARRSFPANFICLAVFTLVFSYMTGTIASSYTTESVMIAAGITAAVCLAVSIFAIQTKIDFTLCSGLIFGLFMVLLFFGLSVMIVYLVTPVDYFAARVLSCVWGGLAALLFVLFLIVDTQLLFGGKKYSLSPEEYIFAALQLYLDIVYLFLIILSLFGGKK